MSSRAITIPGVLFLFLLAATGGVRGQAGSSPAPAHADIVLHGGKIVTVDDATTSPDPGTIAQAIAIRGDRIVAVGTDSSVLAHRGPQTRVVELKGRTVLPGIIDTHSHLFQYAMNHFGARELAKVQTGIRGQPTEDWYAIKKRALATLAEEAARRPAGEWLSIRLPREALFKGELTNAEQAAAKGLITRAELDAITTRHPIHINAATSAVTNSLAQQIIRRDWYGPEEPELLREDGFSSNSVNRNIYTDYLIPDLETVAQIYKAENFEWAGFGITTWATSMRSLRVLAAYMLLDQRAEIGIRLAYAPSAGTPMQVVPQLHVPGYGTDYVWNIGASAKGMDSIYPGIYTSLEPPRIRKEVKDRELAYVSSRLDEYTKFIEDTIAAGHRFASTHTAGDQTLELSLDAIEKGSARAGLTEEQIRARRHAFDHCQMNPRPDQIPRLKKLGVIMSCSPGFIESTSPEVVRDYGEQFLEWIVPVKNLIDGGVKTVLEIDSHDIARHGTVFHYLNLLVNRQVGPRTYGAGQKIDRVHALKMSTAWAAEYLLRERLIGSLEPGKLADLIVLNQDYLTVPAGQIGATKALMTIVGGRIVHETDQIRTSH